MNEPGPSHVTDKKGKALRSEEKQCFLNVFKKFSDANPGSTLENVTRSVAATTGISRTSIYRARK